MDLKKVNLHPYVDYKISNVMSVKEKFGFRVTLYYSDGERKICQPGMQKRQRLVRHGTVL